MAMTHRQIRLNIAKVQASLNLDGGATSHVGGHFDRDAIPIVAFSQESAENWARVASFALLTIRQMFVTMPKQMSELDRDGSACRYLYGWKADSFAFIHAHKREMWDNARAFMAGRIDLDSLILAYLAIPGFGIVKASFLCQMTVGNGACLDSHNLDRMGLRLDSFNCAKSLTVQTVRLRIKAYNRVWSSQGDSAYWWDSWCNYVAIRRRNWFPAGGAQCSALHREVIVDSAPYRAVKGGAHCKRS